MHVVALTELKGDLDTEASHLAQLAGVSAYDVRARVSGPLPKVLMQSVDPVVVRRVLQGLSARGHSAVVCDSAAVVGTAQMVHLHRFNLDASGVWANDHAGDRLEWSDLGVVIIALVRSSTARTVAEEVEGEGSNGLRHPVVTALRDRTRMEHAAFHAAYLFPRARATSRRPWVLEEPGAQFMSLGARMQPTRRANFFATVNAIRAYAPEAVVDDRFVAAPLSAQVIQTRGGIDGAPPSSHNAAVAQLEVTVHVLASWLMREQRGPYR